MADSSLVPFCKRVAEEAKFLVFGREKVEFQFPPKILSDTNMSDWLEVSVWSWEPIRISKGAIGRKVNMEWEYIATDSVFTPEKIWKQIHNLKMYFFKFNEGSDDKVKYPIIEVTYTHVLQGTPFRLRNLNVTHGPEIIENKLTFPLYTKVAVVLELATNVSSEKSLPKLKGAPFIQDKDW